MEHDDYVEYLVSIGHDRATAQTMANAYSGQEADDARSICNRFQQANHDSAGAHGQRNSRALSDVLWSAVCRFTGDDVV